MDSATMKAPCSPRSLALACSLACGLALLPNESSAFCGFYVSGADAKLFNNATVVVLMRDGTRTVLSIRGLRVGDPGPGRAAQR